MTCQLRLGRSQYEVLHAHLFPDDSEEHGAVLLASVAERQGRVTLFVREVHIAREGSDYREGQIGHRALQPPFIHRLITRARDERLAYLAVHNHLSDLTAGFSTIDLDSHERGYPALLQIAKGMPVGALVCGRRSMQADVWLPDGRRLALEEAIVVGTAVTRLRPQPRQDDLAASATFERQVRMFGRAGQRELARCHVGIIGLGGIGSILVEYLARLGVGAFTVVDADRLDESNLSRVVGAFASDLDPHRSKASLAERAIANVNPGARVRAIADDVAKESIARQLVDCDYLFLAADSMRARLVFNALVHQFLIPGVQLGSKVRHDSTGAVVEVLAVNRPVRPDGGCLWCNGLIDSTQLATEAKTDAERQDQAYGVEEPNPSVIALNAVSAGHAVNDFMLDYLGLRPEAAAVCYDHFHCLKRTHAVVQPRRDADCSECAQTGLRFARSTSVELPCLEG